MSIKELKLVPNYILIQVLLTKGMANAEYIVLPGRVAPTILSIKKTCLPTSVILLVELGRGGRPVTDIVYISGVFLDINRDVSKDRYLALPLSLLN